MPLVRYTANKSSNEGTGSLVLATSEDGLERVLNLGGQPLEVTDDELALLSGRYVLEVVGEESVDVSEVGKSDEPDQESPVVVEKPAHFGSDPEPQSPATPGASVSTTPYTSTPEAGS